MHPPCTAAMVGFMTELMSRISSSGASTLAPGGAGRGSFKFAPTQKWRPVARMTTARVVGLRPLPCVLELDVERIVVRVHRRTVERDESDGAVALVAHHHRIVDHRPILRSFV